MAKKDYKAMTVYKASAGSGKTFTLAVRFIELLIENPNAYKQTLAVTFTNKATEEMKQRILSQLYGLSKQLPDSEGYMARICKDLGKDRDSVSSQAKKALTLMLHDYSFFNIETIDAFFQKVLRNLAREMNLNANLRVELNDAEIEEKAVDKLIADLNEKDPVLMWIIGYIDENMAEDKSWNVIDSIKKFGRKIFSDDYKQYADRLQKKFEDDPKFFSRYQTNLKAVIKDADEKVAELAKRFFDTIASSGYSTDDFKKNAVGFFKKLENGEYINDKAIWNKSAQDAAESGKGWVTAKIKPGTPLYQFAEEVLCPLILDANRVRESLVKPVITAKAVMKNINELRLLSKIKGAVNDMNVEENVFLLSDTQNMLHQMMIDNDAPFIFEKIGGPLKNIMIDEFQDTSTIQWKNFRTLLLNCISKVDSLNLIVGDVKQSIYRWRSGDWKLLHSGLASDSHLTSYGMEDETLDDNYRSEGNIIRFNNAFFKHAAQKDAELLENDGNENSEILTQIYEEKLVHQNIPASKKNKDNGLVDILLLSGKSGSGEGGDDSPEFKQQVMDVLTQQLTDLFTAGATDDSICILARGNGELVEMAEYLQDKFRDHSFVSDEAFKLEASFAVNIIIAAIRVLNHPNDRLVKAQLAKLYQEKVLGTQLSEVYFRGKDDIDKYLPTEFVNNNTMLLTKPLTDLAEELFRIFDLKKLEGEAAYIMAFYDQLSSFAQNNIPDLELLLDTWEESMHRKTVKGGALSGVRLLTIHKSKGLEADHVLIPFCDWKLDMFGSDLWCEIKEMPFAEMPVLPVNSRDIKNSLLNKEYMDEQLQICIDNMNMLYVAFTRARKNLFVIGKRVGGTSHSTRSDVIQKTLVELPSALEGSALEYNPEDKEADIHFVYGKLCVENKKEEVSQNVFLQQPVLQQVNIKQEDNKLEFRQSNASRKFVEPEDEENTQLRNTSTGTILHNVLARISDASEVDKVLAEFVQEGRLSDIDPDMNREKMSKLIRSRVEKNEKHPVINRWFSSDVEVFNECTIVAMEEGSGIIKEFRPDRVVKDGESITVIDYKFGRHKEQYINQVKQYVCFLQNMGYKNVKGCLWYVYTNEIKEV